jgi:hypothetical protein
MSRYAASATHVYVIDAGDMAKVGASSHIRRRVTQIVNSYGNMMGGRKMRLHAAWEINGAGKIETAARKALAANFDRWSVDWFMTDAVSASALVEKAMRDFGYDPVAAIRDFGVLPIPGRGR